MTKSMRTYLDYAATTPVDPRVQTIMNPYFGLYFGNPSSIHLFGQQAEGALSSAREKIAQNLKCEPSEIIFTSCGTESDNLALRGAGLAAQRFHGANHILTSPVEHHAVTETAHQMAELFGFDVELLPVDSYGMVDPDDISRRIRKDTAVVSIMYANNEIGTINPIAEIGLVCRDKGVAFHTDAVQGVAYLPTDVQTLKVDMLSIGAHKFYGPKGIGALFVRKDLSIFPIITGGKQENQRRAGTENIPYIIGMAEALRLANLERDQRTIHMSNLRDYLIRAILDDIQDSKLTGHPTIRLPNHASFVFKGVDGNELLMLLDIEGFACSSGSACKTGNPEPSEVLNAIGLEPDWALGSIRVTLGKETKSGEIDAFLTTLKACIAKARKIS
jgi:cysteine desulfurase